MRVRVRVWTITSVLVLEQGDALPHGKGDPVGDVRVAARQARRGVEVVVRTTLQVRLVVVAVVEELYVRLRRNFGCSCGHGHEQGRERGRERDRR